MHQRAPARAFQPLSRVFSGRYVLQGNPVSGVDLIMKLVLALVFILAAGSCLAETAPGVRQIRALAAHNRVLDISIWYPSDEHASVNIGGNAVFTGASGAAGAPLPEGPLPLVLVSHGGLRSAADSGAWLSSSIARNGFIVAEVNAPRPETAEIAMDEIWQRPTDISRAIDMLLEDATWRDRIDRESIFAVGFALGGTASLAVAGLRLDADRYMQSCDPASNKRTAPDCAWFAAQGVSLAKANKAALEAPLKDARIAKAIAIDPEYADSYQSKSEIPNILLISLEFYENIAHNYVAAADASAVDAFSECTVAGPEILMDEEGDASICGASPDSRHVIHQKLTTLVLSFLSASTAQRQ